MADEKQTPRATLEVFRYRPEQESQPTFQQYDVPFRDDWVVLDALQYIKDHLDGTLSFRWSCHMGICGSCGVMINGDPKLSCAAFLRDYHPAAIRVEPLANFPVIRDLVINIDDFLDKLGSLKPWLLPQSEPMHGEHRQQPAELAHFLQFSMCINCMLCYSACPVYGRDPDFIGPAAIALAQRYNLDSRDAGSESRSEALSAEQGIWKCTFIGECSRVCPKDVDPAAAIQQAKLAATKRWYRSLLLPWGKRS